MARPDPLDLAAVYVEHAQPCYRLAIRIVRDRDLAADVIQNVFETLARRPQSYDPDRGALSTFLMTLTHHKAVDLLRTRRVHTGRDVRDDGLDEHPDLSLLPDDAAVLHDEHEHTVAAVRRLRPDEREVIALAYYGGYTQAQIAERLHVPLGTVKSRTRMALRHLRVSLATA